MAGITQPLAATDHDGVVFRRALLVSALVTLAVACGEEPSTQRTATSDSTAPTADPAPTTPSTAVSAPGASPSEPRRSLGSFEQAITVQAEEVEPGTEGEPISASTAVAVSGRGTIAVGSARGLVRFADSQGEYLDSDDSAHSDAITSVEFVGTTEDLITAGEDGKLLRWSADDVDSWSSRSLLDEPEGAPYKALAVSPDGSTVATGGVDQVVRLWDAEEGTPVEEWPAAAANLDSTILALVFSPDWARGGSGWIGASNADGSAFLISDAGAGQATAVSPDAITSLAFTADGRELVVSGAEAPWLVSTETGTSGPLDGSPALSGPVIAVATEDAGDDTLIAIAGDRESSDSTGDESSYATPVLHLFTASEPQEKLSYSGLSSAVVDMAFTPGANAIVVATDDRVDLLPFDGV